MIGERAMGTRGNLKKMGEIEEINGTNLILHTHTTTCYTRKKHRQMPSACQKPLVPTLPNLGIFRFKLAREFQNFVALDKHFFKCCLTFCKQFNLIVFVYSKKFSIWPTEMLLIIHL